MRKALFEIGSIEVAKYDANWETYKGEVFTIECDYGDYAPAHIMLTKPMMVEFVKAIAPFLDLRVSTKKRNGGEK